MIYDMNKNVFEGNCEVVVPYFSEPPRPFNITNFSTSNQSNIKDLDPIVKLIIGFYMYLICNLFYLVIKDNCYRLKEYSEEEVSEEEVSEEEVSEEDDDEDYDENDDDYEEELESEDMIKMSKRQKENAAYQRRKSLRSYNK